MSVSDVAKQWDEWLRSKEADWFEVDRDDLRTLVDAALRTAALERDCASISAEFGLPPTIRPAEGEMARMKLSERADERENCAGFLESVPLAIATRGLSRLEALKAAAVALRATLRAKAKP